MAYWLFKISEQDLYPDKPGISYVFDNTHSVRVKKGDTFLYLDKARGYSFTATGTVGRIAERKPTLKESERTRKIRVVYTAHLADVIWFSSPLSISPTKIEGKRVRAQLGIRDVNLLGWSQSIPSLNEEMYSSIIDIAELKGLFRVEGSSRFSIPDTWGRAKSRPAMTGFSALVLGRSLYSCIVCGTQQPGLVDAAHLSPYATDIENRANPANGICLCKYCHRALDLRLIAISPSGELLVSPEIKDPVAEFHFAQIDAGTRRRLLLGVDPAFLELTVKWHNEYLYSKATSRTSS